MSNHSTRLERIRERLAAQLPDGARMDAYYYGFDKTDFAPVDAILSAVAIAGKASHHTESWGDASEHGYFNNRPGLPDAESAIELIENAAAEATHYIKADLACLLSVVAEQAATIERVEKLIDSPFGSADKRHYDDQFNRGHVAGYNAAAHLLRNALEPSQEATP